MGEGTIAGQRVALALPQTYMNLSGESVVQLVNWYKPERDQLIICFDDVDLPEGKLRFRPSGSAGTHNGMRNIIYLLGRDDFPRPARWASAARPRAGTSRTTCSPAIAPPPSARPCSTPS